MSQAPGWQESRPRDLDGKDEMSAPLLTTKLYIPPVRSELVSRPRLIEQLNAGVDRKLTLVSAAAGFGKTTLVAEWLNRVERPCTWLSLDKGDNDPVQFVTYLIAALKNVEEGIGQAAQSLLGAPQLPPIESLVTLLINDIAATPQPFVLVLDDYDAIQTESIHLAVEFLIEHQPPQVQLVLVTRQDPPLPLPRLRVRRQVVEICEEDLRFTPEIFSTRRWDLFWIPRSSTPSRPGPKVGSPGFNWLHSRCRAGPLSGSPSSSSFSVAATAT
jgi:LuxR family maltose regulon positive regulatory protein